MKRPLWIAAAVLLAELASTVPAGAEAPFAVRLADSILTRWPDPAAISDKGWEYNTGIVLRGVAEVYRKSRDPRYLDYIRRWVDSHIREDGSIDFGEDAGGHNLDRIQPGVLVLLLLDETREPKYEKTARWLRSQYDRFPRNHEGGFWHKKRYPNEMWLDGIYMSGPFLVRYGRLLGEPGFCYDTAVTQATLVAERTRLPGAGLFRHAWDEDRNAAWANPSTGVSPLVWGRAMGWYLMALVDMLADLPAEHPGYSAFRALLREGARGIQSTQDPRTGLWYQIVDRGELQENWLETSASAMFVYALERGVSEGHLAASYVDVAQKAWQGLESRVAEDAEGRPVIEGAVEGMGVQTDLAGYLGRKRLQNSTHGLCAMLLAASQRMEKPSP